MAALGMLRPFNAGAQAATILKDRNPGALQVAMGRNNAEDKMAQKMLAAKVAAKGEVDKQKEVNKGEAAKNINTLAKESVFRYHGPTYKAALNGYIDEYAQASQLHAQEPDKYGDPDDPGTEAGSYFFKKQADLGQMVKSSKDIQASHDATLAYMQAHPEEFTPGSIQAMEADYADPKHLLDNTVVEKPTHLWNVEKNIAATFAPMEDMVTAWANPTGDGGVVSGSISKPIDGAVKALAESFSSGEWAYPALMKRFESMEPAAQERISKIAEANGMSKAGALAMDMAGNLYGATKQTAGRTAPNDAGYGQSVDEAGAINFIEKGIGMNDPANKGRSLKDIGLGDVMSVTDFLNNNPQFQRFSVNIPKNAELFNGYNGMVYEMKEADGKKINRYVAGIVREPNTGKTQVVTVDGTGGTPKVSNPIPSEKFYSEVMDPLAVNSEELDHKKVGYIFQKKYTPIYQQEGNVKLPKKGGAWDLNDAGELE